MDFGKTTVWRKCAPMKHGCVNPRCASTSTICCVASSRTAKDKFDVQVITQNVDNLHEQAGAKNVLHLHGELMKCRPEGYDQGVYYPLDPENPDIKMGDVDSHGVQLRPHIVFFGEDVPNLSRAADIMETADIVVVIGTSLNVYPAASLLRYAPSKAPIWLIDPKPVHSPYREVTQIQKGASEGMKELDKILRG